MFARLSPAEMQALLTRLETAGDLVPCAVGGATAITPFPREDLRWLLARSLERGEPFELVVAIRTGGAA